MYIRHTDLKQSYSSPLTEEETASPVLEVRSPASPHIITDEERASSSSAYTSSKTALG
jgi:hypothetical protein